MMHIEMLRDVNGHVEKFSKDFDNFNALKNYSKTPFPGLVQALFEGNADEYKNKFVNIYSPRKTNPDTCNTEFPPSNGGVYPDTKELKIVISACMVGEDEYRVDLEDNYIITTFSRKPEDREFVYDHKGLRLVQDEVVPYKFDPRYYDPNTIEAHLEKGCVIITMQPREEVKPVRRTIAGNLPKKSEKEIDAVNTENSESDK